MHGVLSLLDRVVTPLQRRLRVGVRPAALLLALAGCVTDPTVDYLGGIGDPVRGAALYAPRNLGDTSRWAGQPAGAARAVVQLEFLADEFAANPRYAPEADPTVTLRLERARAELRAALGIAADATPALVTTALRRAATALDAGTPALAEAALAGPAFTLGPPATLARLADLPRLPRTAEAAGAVAAEIDRLRRRR